MTQSYPTIRQIVLDTEDARGLAEFYREVFGFTYREGDEPPPVGGPDPKSEDWLVLRNRDGGMASRSNGSSTSRGPPGRRTRSRRCCIWTPRCQIEELHRQHERVLALGGTLLYDRSDDEEEPLFVYADPAGHPFCIFVGN